MPKSLRAISCALVLLLTPLAAAEAQSDADAPPEGQAQDTPREAALELSPNPVGRGDRITITIEIPNPDFGEVDVEAPQLDDALRILRGPYIRPFYEYPEEGGRLEKSRITYVYSPRETGRFAIGEFRITTEEGEYTTAPRLLEVGVYRQRTIVVPPQLEWNLPRSQVYVGQNLPLVLEVRGEPEIGMFEDISVEKPAEGFFQQAPQLGSIERYMRGGMPLYTIPVDGYIFTPAAPGEVRIPRAYLNANGVRSQSDMPLVRVEPLPDALGESGAIGEFSRSATLSRNELTEGEELQLRVRLEGTGNLNYLRFPEPRLDGFRILDDREQSRLEPGAEGFQGYREITYTLAAIEPGRREILVPRISALRPASDSVYRLPERRFRVEVAPAAGSGSAGREAGDFPFRPRERAEMSGMNITARYAQAGNYLWLLPGPLTFLIFFLLKRRKMGLLSLSLVLFLSFTAPPPDESSHLMRGLDAYEEEQFGEALVQFELALQEYDRFPDLYFNAALAAYRSGALGKAVYFSREAAYLAPGDSEYTRLLTYIEEEKEFGRRVPLPFPVHPDMLFLGLTLMLNLSGFAGVIYLSTRRNLVFIAASLALVIALGMGVTMAYSAESRSQRAGVVVWGDTAAQLIPQSGASPAFSLSEGETVLIIGKSAPFYFVENALGQKGWLLEHELRIVGEFFSSDMPKAGPGGYSLYRRGRSAP